MCRYVSIAVVVCACICSPVVLFHFVVVVAVDAAPSVDVIGGAYVAVVGIAIAPNVATFKHLYIMIYRYLCIKCTYFPGKRTPL